MTIDDTEIGPSNGFVIRITYNSDENFQSPKPRNAQIMDHYRFATTDRETGFQPVKGACNGREMRRILCVVDGDEPRHEQRFLMLDLNDYSQAIDGMPLHGK